MVRHWISSICLTGAVLLNTTSGVVAEECKPETFAGAFDGEVTLCQNWDYKQQQEFWFTPQGSRIIPYSWFLALKKVESTEKFSSAENLDRLRYLPQKKTELNEDSLPIGFTKDDVSKHDAYSKYSASWLGMTCSACHTAQIEFGGNRILIDGAPAMADFEGFITELTEALRATWEGKDRFNVFASEVLGSSNVSKSKMKQLKKDLSDILTIRETWNTLNKGEHLYGFARLDAIGAIFNAVGATAQDDTNQSVGHKANAPVSYPFIWDTPQHDKVQWNGSVANENAGALGRNIGEVLGVFGALKYNPINFDLRDCIETEEGGWFSTPIRWVKSLVGVLTDDIICAGHATSVKIGNLGKLEFLLRSLWSPEWPKDLLGPIDDSIDSVSGKSRVQLGEELFKQNCLDCHDGRSKKNKAVKPFKRNDADRFIDAKLIPVQAVGTDELMAKNFADLTYPMRKDLQGQVISFIPLRTPQKGDFFQSSGHGFEILKYTVLGTIVNKLLNDPVATIEALQVGQKPKVQEFLEKLKKALADAKASGSPFRGLAVLRKAVIEIKRKKIAKLTKTVKDDPMFKAAAKLDEIWEKLRLKIKAGKANTGSDAAAEAMRRKFLMVYKARPLNGIWATGPYLHNGSVRTIRQLLLPAKCPEDENGNQIYTPGECRQITFKLGSRQFDPENIGFADAGNFVMDTRLKGNRNTGHNYGHMTLAKDKRLIGALLEYIKTL